MLKRIFNNKQGVTLVEMIIAMLISTIVIGVVLTMFIFGNNSYAHSNQQYDIQSDVRLISDYIQREVRYASFIQLINEPTFDEFPEMDPLDKKNLEYIFFDENDQLVHKIWDEAGGNFEAIKYGTSFTLPGSSFDCDGQELILLVDADDRPSAYQLETIINLPNMTLLNLDIPKMGTLDETKKGLIFSRESTMMAMNPIVDDEGGDDGTGGGDDGGGDVELPPFTIEVATSLPEWNTSERLGLTCPYQPQSVTVLNQEASVDLSVTGFILITFSPPVQNNNTVEIEILATDDENNTYVFKFKNNTLWQPVV